MSEDDYEPEDLVAAHNMLLRYDFEKIGQNQEQVFYKHIDGHEVGFDLTNRYPFNVCWGGRDWEFEFSLEGLLVELQEGFDRIEEES